jgi:hypothetical protein
LTVTLAPTVPAVVGFGADAALAVELAPVVDLAADFTATGDLAVTISGQSITPVELVAAASVPAQTARYTIAATPRARYTATVGSQP